MKAILILSGIAETESKINGFLPALASLFVNYSLKVTQFVITLFHNGWLQKPAINLLFFLNLQIGIISDLISLVRVSSLAIIQSLG